MNDARERLLSEWATRLDRAARAGALTGDATKPIRIREIGAIAGPRAGALEIDAGLDAGRLLRALTADAGAVMRQFVPWPFIGEPACYLGGRCVRVEAGWPDALAEKSIRLSDLGLHPSGSGRWVAGKNEYGQTVTLGLSDHAAHFGVFGTTGSGKSVAIRSLVSQLAGSGDRLVLVDGKFGEGLRDLDRLPNVIGPLAMDADAARAALGWALAEMTRRYEAHDTAAPRAVVVVDEVQELVSDPAIVEMLRRVAAQGRAARVSLILSTQHPTMSAFGGDPTIKRNVTGRIALRVADAKSSEVAIGQSTPRADWLLGAGDAYAVVPGAVQRLQVAYVGRDELDGLLTGAPLLATWPEFHAEAIGQIPGSTGWPSGAEVGASILSTSRGEGRVKFVRSLQVAGLPGMSPERAVRLLGLGRDALAWLGSQGVSVRSDDEAYTDDDETGA
jgi:hypothetical protein